MKKELRVYMEDVYTRETESTVLEVKKTLKGTAIILDISPFFPEGGGQSCDLGYINEIPVSYVFEDKDTVYHVVPEDYVHLVGPGDKVHCVIDWDRRFDNMQRHCGEHILSGVIHKEYGGVNRGFHMGDNYMTIDIAMEDDPDYKELTPAMTQHVEACANKVVWSNLPIRVDYFDTREEAEQCKLRKPLAIDEEISIVTIGDPEDPADCCACCGTHPAHTGEVGLIKIYKVEKNKNMFRVYLEAGKRAMEKFDQTYAILDQAAQSYSSDHESFLDKLAKAKAQEEALKAELNEMKGQLLGIHLDKLKDTYKKDPDVSEPRCYTVDNVEIKDFMHVSKKVAAIIGGMLVVRFPKEKAVLMFAKDDTDCGATVRKTAGQFGGKGGGSRDFARVAFEDEDSMNAFINSL